MTRRKTKTEKADNPPDAAGRFAAFDTTIGRYCSGVHPTKAAAKKASTAPTGHRVEVREV